MRRDSRLAANAKIAAKKQDQRAAQLRDEEEYKAGGEYAHDGIQGVVGQLEGVRGVVDDSNQLKGHRCPRRDGHVERGLERRVVADGPYPVPGRQDPQVEGKDHEQHQDVAQSVQGRVENAAGGARCAAVCRQGDAGGVDEISYSHDDLVDPALGVREYNIAFHRFNH